MNTKTVKLSPPLITLMVISLLSLGVAITIPICTNMSVVTFIRSLNSESITPEELNLLQKNNSNSLILIDVRSPEEYDEGHIKGSVLIPITDIEQGFGVTEISKLAKKNSSNNTIVLYCTHATRSLKAYQILKKNGIATVNLKGGITAWDKKLNAPHNKS